MTPRCDVFLLFVAFVYLSLLHVGSSTADSSSESKEPFTTTVSISETGHVQVPFFLGQSQAFVTLGCERRDAKLAERIGLVGAWSR